MNIQFIITRCKKPTCEYTAVNTGSKIQVSIIRDIEKGAELTTNYTSEQGKKPDSWEQCLCEDCKLI